jgi:hypothetical protein
VPVGDTRYRLHQGESLLVPAGFYYGVHNPGTERLVIQQVSGPKPWDARFGGLNETVGSHSTSDVHLSAMTTTRIAARLRILAGDDYARELVDGGERQAQEG